jgi:copper chaperone
MTEKFEYQVTGMSCGHCEASVRAEIAKIPGVDGIDVSAKSGTLVVSSSTALVDADVIAAVDEAGYTAVRA